MRARPPREITTAEAVSSSFQDVTAMPNERSFGPRPSVQFLCLPHLLELRRGVILKCSAPGRTGADFLLGMTHSSMRRLC